MGGWVTRGEIENRPAIRALRVLRDRLTFSSQGVERTSIALSPVGE